MQSIFKIAGSLLLASAISACCGPKNQTKNEPVKNVHDSIIEQEDKKQEPPNRVAPEKKTITPPPEKTPSLK